MLLHLVNPILQAHNGPAVVALRWLPLIELPLGDRVPTHRPSNTAVDVTSAPYTAAQTQLGVSDRSGLLLPRRGRSFRRLRRGRLRRLRGGRGVVVGGHLRVDCRHS